MYACLYAEGNLALLVECARYFSPRYEEYSADAVLVDLRGAGLLFGSWAEIADAMQRRIGVAANIALAGDPDSAFFLARSRKGITLIHPGEEAEALASVPLRLLPCSSETAAVLHAWGFSTFGELAALPAAGIAARLGAEGTALLRLVRGENNRQLRTVETPRSFRDDIELESPVALLEPLLFLLGRLLNELCAALMRSALSTDEVRLALTLENAPTHSCVLRLPIPLCDPMVLLKLLQLELGERPPAAAILKISLELEPAPPRKTQHNLFVAAGPEPQVLEVTLAKLRHLLGADCVGAPHLLNTHRPDAFSMQHFPGNAAAPQNPFPAQPALALRRYRPPKLAQVTKHQERPAQVRSGALRAKVIAAAGPWRTSGDWWNTLAWNRDEWDVALANGVLYRLYEEVGSQRWFVEGVYD